MSTKQFEFSPSFLGQTARMNQSEFEYHFRRYSEFAPGTRSHEEALKCILLGHVWLARHVARSLSFNKDIIPDLVQDALTACARIHLPRYTPHPDYPFVRYLSKAFRNSMIDADRAADYRSIVHVPRRERKMHKCFSESLECLEHLDRDDLFDCLGYRMNPEQLLLRAEEISLLYRAVESLTSRDRDVFVRRNGLNGEDKQKAKDLAVEYCVSEPRISQLHSRAKKAVKQWLQTESA